MNKGPPGIWRLSLWIASRKLHPSVVKISEVAMLVAHPDQGRRCVRHHPEALVTLSQIGFRPLLAPSLPQQGYDQQGLKPNEHRPEKNELLITFPSCRLTVQDDGVSR